jgi:3'(2'), 5'-bisphosphate nucleotidase
LVVVDYAAQALISKLIFAHFPDYKLVGEEDSKDLRFASQAGLRAKISELANWALELPSEGSSDPWSFVGSKALEESVWLEAIDRGDASQTSEGRVWALDPIDGTKGFLSKGQYAICLALLEGGKPVLGVIGCPNLNVKIGDSSSRGVLFAAIQGEGAFQVRSLSYSVVTHESQRSFTDPTWHAD